MCYGPSDYRAVTNISIDSLLIKRVCSIIPTTHNSDSPLLRQPITPTAHYSDNPLFRQPIVPTANNLAQQRNFFMTSGPGKQTTIDKTIDSKSCRRSTRTDDEKWAVGVMGCRSNGLSELWAVGIMLRTHFWSTLKTSPPLSGPLLLIC
jgi:hypothetical protein